MLFPELVFRLKWFALVAQWGLTEETFKDLPKIGIPKGAAPEIFDSEVLGAEHYNALLMNTFANEGFYCNHSGLVGGDPPQPLLEFLASQPATSSEAWDHLSVQLRFLAQSHYEDELQFVVGDHLLQWLPPFVISLRFGASPFYAGFGEALWKEITNIAGWFKAEFRPTSEGPFTSPLSEKTSLADIAEQLLIPARSGWVLTRHDVSELARSQDLHHGFGSRNLMLTNLLQASGKFDAFSRVMKTLMTLKEHWERGYHSLVSEQEWLRPTVAPWLNRLEETERLLHHLEEQAGQGEQTP